MDKYKKYTDRIESLINEFNKEIYPRREPNNFGGYCYPHSMFDTLQGWLMKAENVLCIISSENSIQIKRFRTLRDNLKDNLEIKLNQIKGLLDACLDDLKNGFIQGQEFVIANEVFDSVLEEAKFFIEEQKNKDIGAILLRIVLEDAIKRISNKEGIEIEGKKASILNEELKSKGIFIQTVWRQNQAWLDIGNSASHGKFDEYTLNQVENFYQGLVNFLSTYFN